ncbi:hypothetical protein FBEOM_5920 [Fusarium beomiforme]|uniref:Uncharacterized protein n=1 Tax=Fusarium beomiforme TaxID=44412 RepID=A0A9P5AKP2_9HYPO|nr:hypothetical protein FBEOM_5920 [Fusarium beomiforme]
MASLSAARSRGNRYTARDRGRVSVLQGQLSDTQKRIYKLKKKVKDRRQANMTNQERQFRDIVMKKTRRRRQAMKRALKDESQNALKQESASGPDEEIRAGKVDEAEARHAGKAPDKVRYRSKENGEAYDEFDVPDRDEEDRIIDRDWDGYLALHDLNALEMVVYDWLIVREYLNDRFPIDVYPFPE